MSKKNKKQFKLEVDLQEERAVKHMMNAYGILCELRQAQGVSRLSPDRWFGTVLIEGANAMINHYNKVVAEQQAKVEEAKKNKKIEDVKEEPKKDVE